MRMDSPNPVPIEVPRRKLRKFEKNIECSLVFGVWEAVKGKVNQNRFWLEAPGVYRM